MNTGMQDAFNLAWKLASVTRGAAGEGLLDTYSAECSPIAAQVLSSAGKMTRAAMLKNEVAQALRNFVVDHILVRPDGYVALTARADDWQAVKSYLDMVGSCTSG